MHSWWKRWVLNSEHETYRIIAFLEIMFYNWSIVINLSFILTHLFR